MRVYRHKVGSRVMFPQIHVFEAVDNDQRKVVDRFADVMQRVCKLDPVSRQHSHHI